MGDEQLRLRRISDDTVVCDRLVMGESFGQRFMGLMGRASMAEGEGLYLATSSIHMMFMRFPIDALFISRAAAGERRTVVGVRPDLPPWRGIVLPVRGAEAVVEMAAGRLGRVGIEVGDEVIIEPANVGAEGQDKAEVRGT